jgi:peptidoglycan DL-endopeptidase LytE
MSIASRHRLLSIFLLVVVLLTTLLSAAPVLANSDGSAEYAVKKGETLTSIAKKFGLTVEKILLANPDLENPNHLRTGQVIILPAGRSEGIVPQDLRRIYVWQREANGGRVAAEENLYLVKSGDNLTRIARSYGLTLEKLLAANPQIDDPNKLLRGELVHIPDGRAEIVPPFYSTPRPPSK